MRNKNQLQTYSSYLQKASFRQAKSIPLSFSCLVEELPAKE